MRYFVFLILAIIQASCATSPTGTAELMKRVNADLKSAPKSRVKDLSEGRPVFMDVQSYPQILPSGDLWLGGDMLVHVGREQMNFTELADRYLSESKPAPVPVEEKKP